MSADSVVPDSSMTASSQRDATTPPSGGRLHNQAQYNDQNVLTQIGAWAAATADKNQWLQIMFKQTFQITGVATQGQEDADYWVTTYKLDYSTDGSTWSSYPDVRLSCFLVAIHICVHMQNEVNTCNWFLRAEGLGANPLR